MQLQNKHDTDDRWIYERNPDTGEIFRRKFGDYDSPRECINPAVNSVPNIKTKIMNMMSLYDYLGRAAGPELGQRVATAAAAQKVKFQTKLVDHKGYTGDVMMYPKSFLDLFFGGGLSEGGESGKQLLKG